MINQSKTSKHIAITLFLCTATLVNATCLDKFNPYFSNYQANIVYQSTTPQSYLIQTPSGDSKTQCRIAFTTLQNYLKQQYQHNNKHAEIKQGWNYLALNNQVIYDFLATISPQQMKTAYADFTDNPKQKFEVSNQAKYTPISIFNNKYACYSYNLFTMATGAAHPDTQIGLSCISITNKEPLTLADVSLEKPIVTQLVQTNYLSQLLTKAKIKPTTITTFAQLQNAIEKINDDELSCYGGTLTMNDSSFAISKLNSDGSINLKLGLNSDIGACSSMYREIELTNIKPKLKITQLISAQDF